MKKLHRYRLLSVHDADAPPLRVSETGGMPDWFKGCWGQHRTDVTYVDMPQSIEYRCHDCHRAERLVPPR